MDLITLPPSLAEFSESTNNTSAGKFDTYIFKKNDALEEGRFGIKVSDVSKEVCQNNNVLYGYLVRSPGNIAYTGRANTSNIVCIHD